MEKLDIRIRKAKEELAKYEEIVLNGENPDDTAQREEAEKLEKFLIRYKKVLNRVQGSNEGEDGDKSLGERTLEVFEENDQYNAKCERYIKKKTAQLEELKTQLNEKIALRKERLAKNKESKQEYEIELQNKINAMKRQKKAYEKLLNSLTEFDSNQKLTIDFFLNNKDVLKREFNEMSSIAKSFSFDDAEKRALNIENALSAQKEKENSKIKDLKEKINKARSDLSGLKEMEKQRNKYLQDKSQIENNIMKTRKRTNDIVQKLASSMENRRPLIDVKLNINKFNTKIDKFNFQKVCNNLQEKTNQLKAINGSKLKPSSIRVDPNKFQMNLEIRELPGFVDYKTYKAKALEYCTDPAEFEFFLYDDEKLIKIYLSKLQQRNNTRENKKSSHQKSTEQFLTNSRKYEINLRRIKDDGIKKEREEALQNIRKSIEKYLD